MKQVEKWKVVCTGNIESGFPKEDVVNNLKILLQISNNQAEALISGISTVVKKDLNQAKASQYASALKKAGVQIRIEGMPLVLESDFDSLSLVPIEDEVTDASLVESGIDSSSSVGAQQDRDIDRDGYEKDSIWELVTAKQIGLALLSLFILMSFFVWGGNGYQKIGSSSEAIAQYSAFKEMQSHPTPDLGHLRGLLEKGHYSKVESILSELHNNVSDDISWEIPFRQTVYDMSLEENIRLGVLNKWVKSTHSAYAYMVRGAYYTEAGYNARGAKYKSHTTPEQFSLYAKLHRKAHQNLLKAKSIDNSLLPLYSLLIITAKSSGSSIQKKVYLDEAIAINPKGYHYRYAYITHLKPRWGGSWSAMQHFVDETKPYFENNPRLWLLQGYVAADKGDIAAGKRSYDNCISFLSEALQYGRQSVWLYDRAYCLSRKMDFEKSLKDVNMSLEMDGDKKEAKELKRYLDSKV
ncbi:MAG: hypothetical protein L3J51_06680 [Cocleimonas sp.]|nr:hypothetical protein [Cocleimonas sp.]